MRKGLIALIGTVSALSLAACANMSDTAGTAGSSSTQVARAPASTDNQATRISKRPDPQTIRFVEEQPGTLHAGINETTWGRLWFKQVDHRTYLDYLPTVEKDKSDTRLVIVCTETREKLAFPIFAKYSGPIPSCRYQSDLVFAAE